MQADMNNPAGRLYNILVEAKTYNPNTNAKEAWCKLLDISNNEQYLLIGRIGKVYSLADEIFIELSKLDNGNIRRRSAWTATFESSFTSCNLNNSWSTFIGHISDSLLDYLEMTSSILRAENPQPVMSDSALSELYQKAKELIAEMDSIDMPADLKKYMKHQLQKVCIAIDEYKITGAADLVDIVEASIGKYVTQPDLQEASRSNEGAKKFWSLMSNALITLSVVATPLQIASSAKDLGLLPSMFEQNGVEIIQEEQKEVVIEGEVEQTTSSNDPR